MASRAMETTEKPRLITHPRIILFLGVVALFMLEWATWDCHFCFYFKTPMGVTSLLLPATLLLWLWYPGYSLLEQGSDDDGRDSSTE